jgi:hypothetical protein
MSGNLLRTAVYANENSAYFLKNGDSPTFPVLTTDELIVNSVGGGNAVLVQSATGDANVLIQGDLEANLTLDAPASRLIVQAQDNTGASEVIVRSAPFGSGSNVNEIIASANDTLYGAPTNLIQQNAYKPGGVILRQKLAKEDDSDFCFTTLSTDFTGISGNIATTVLSVLDNNAMAVQSLTLQPNGATFNGPLEVQTGEITLGGKPASVSSVVPFVGVSGIAITVPAGDNQTISGSFAVVENHSYRISVQCEIVSGDTNPGAFVQLTAEVPTNIIGLGLQLGGPNNAQGARAYSGVFKATATSSGCLVKALNATIASATINVNPTSASFNPGVLVEDLGLL